MGAKFTANASMIPLAVQTISATNTTATACNSTTQTAHVLHVSVETTDARYRADGTSPTNSTGVLMTKALAPYWFEGYNGTADLEFVRAGGSGTSTIHIQPYKYTGARS